MKAVNEMNNVERGKLLADLFPSEVQGILDAIPLIYKMLSDNKEEIADNWENGMITFDFWFSLANRIDGIISKEGKQLLKSRRFSDQLFDGYNALFTIDCIVKYAEKERKGSNFYHMVNALFNYEIS